MKKLYDTNGNQFYRMSRWISVFEYPIKSQENSLWYYAEKLYGSVQANEEMKQYGYISIPAFRYHNKIYALDRFILMNGIWAQPMSWEQSDGIHNMTGYDVEGDIYHATMIQFSDQHGGPNSVGAVRVYQEF